jgi:hypothetical protein
MTEARSVTATFNSAPQTAQKVAALYVAFFMRAPDVNGMTYWKSFALASGLSDLALMQSMAAGFAGHPSFNSIYGALDNAAYVDAIYLNIGGKPADAAGRAYWLGRMTAGLSRSGFAAEFVYYLLDLTEPMLRDMFQRGEITQAELQDALSRRARMENRSEVAFAYVDALGLASNLLPGTDPMSPASLEQDPAYRASKNIVRSVTADPASMAAPLGYLAGSPTIEGINALFGAP